MDDDDDCDGDDDDDDDDDFVLERSLIACFTMRCVEAITDRVFYLRCFI